MALDLLLFFCARYDCLSSNIVKHVVDNSANKREAFLYSDGKIINYFLNQYVSGNSTFINFLMPFSNTDYYVIGSQRNGYNRIFSTSEYNKEKCKAFSYVATGAFGADYHMIVAIGY